MSFLGRKKDKDDKQQQAGAPPPMIDPNTGLPPPYEPPDPNADKAKDGEKVGFVQGIRNYIMDSYNGLYKIVLEPSMPKRATIAILIVGVLLGIFFAYMLAPVELTGAHPRRLSDDGLQQWVRMVAVGHATGGYSDDSALLVLQQIPNPQQVVNNVVNNPQVPPEEQQAVANLQTLPGYNELTGSVAPRDPGFIASTVSIILFILAVMIITPILVVAWRLLIYPNIVAGIIHQVKLMTNAEYREQKEREQRDRDTLKEQNRLKEEMKKNVVADANFGAPVMQNISIYTKGRNYDDSFAIELGPEQGNQFLGECGAGIATKVNDELQAVEFWGFDMATQATLTKIFVAPGSVNDPTLQAKVSNRVENPATDIVAAQPGAKLNLDTEAIRIQAEIATITYNDAGGAPNSAIENMQMKIVTWQKQGNAVSTPAGAVGGPPPIPPPQPLPDYSDMTFDPPPQMPQSQPASPPAGGKSMDEYANMTFDPPPQMPQSQPAPPPAGGKSMDEYDDIQFDPPPQMPGRNPLQPPPLQMPQSGGLNPLKPPPLQMPPDDDDDDDPFGGTGDFTPLR